MRIILLTLTLPLGLWLVGCFGGAREQPDHRSYPLGFERPVEMDTVDFVHLQFEGFPLSVEIMGQASLPLENSYTLMVQVGVYRAPGFDSSLLSIATDSMRVTANGLLPAYQSPGRVVRNQPPWAAMTAYQLVFNYDSLLARAGGGAYARFDIEFPQHLTYDKVPVAVPIVHAFGPLLSRPPRAEQ